MFNLLSTFLIISSFFISSFSFADSVVQAEVAYMGGSYSGGEYTGPGSVPSYNPIIDNDTYKNIRPSTEIVGHKVPVSVSTVIVKLDHLNLLSFSKNILSVKLDNKSSLFLKDSFAPFADKNYKYDTIACYGSIEFKEHDKKNNTLNFAIKVQTKSFHQKINYTLEKMCQKNMLNNFTSKDGFNSKLKIHFMNINSEKEDNNDRMIDSRNRDRIFDPYRDYRPFQNTKNDFFADSTAIAE
jgi:hypothetical protein